MLSGKIYTGKNRDLFSHPLLDGVKVSFAWRDFQKKPGEYDFSALRAELDAIPSNKQKVLEVLGGIFAPEYLSPRLKLYEEPGRKGHSFPVDLPIVWHKNYIRAAKDLFLALGQEVGCKGLAGINATFISSCGPKLRFTPKNFDPKSGEEEFHSYLWDHGYGPSAMIDAWVEIAKAAAHAFPLATFLLPLEGSEEDSFPPLNDKGEARAEIVDLQRKIVLHCLANYPDRTMVLWSGDEMPEPAFWSEVRGASMGYYPKGDEIPEGTSALFVGQP